MHKAIYAIGIAAVLSVVAFFVLPGQQAQAVITSKPITHDGFNRVEVSAMIKDARQGKEGQYIEYSAAKILNSNANLAWAGITMPNTQQISFGYYGSDDQKQFVDILMWDTVGYIDSFAFERHDTADTTQAVSVNYFGATHSDIYFWVEKSVTTDDSDGYEKYSPRDEAHKYTYGDGKLVDEVRIDMSSPYSFRVRYLDSNNVTLYTHHIPIANIVSMKLVT